MWHKFKIQVFICNKYLTQKSYNYTVVFSKQELGSWLQKLKTHWVTTQFTQLILLSYSRQEWWRTFIFWWGIRWCWSARTTSRDDVVELSLNHLQYRAHVLLLHLDHLHDWDKFFIDLRELCLLHWSIGIFRRRRWFSKTKIRVESSDMMTIYPLTFSSKVESNWHIEMMPILKEWFCIPSMHADAFLSSLTVGWSFRESTNVFQCIWDTYT